MNRTGTAEETQKFGRLEIETGIKRRPRRVLIYGADGIGKSIFGAGTPQPIFLATEQGVDDLNVNRLPLVRNWADVTEAMHLLGSESHGFNTVVVDS